MVKSGLFVSSNYKNYRRLWKLLNKAEIVFQYKDIANNVIIKGYIRGSSGIYILIKVVIDKKGEIGVEIQKVGRRTR